MPTCCALLAGLRAAPASSGHKTWLGAGAGAPPRSLLGSATALRAPGLGAIFAPTYTRIGSTENFDLSSDEENSASASPRVGEPGGGRRPWGA